MSEKRLLSRAAFLFGKRRSPLEGDTLVCQLIGLFFFGLGGFRYVGLAEDRVIDLAKIDDDDGCGVVRHTILDVGTCAKLALDEYGVAFLKPVRRLRETAPRFNSEPIDNGLSFAPLFPFFVDRNAEPGDFFSAGEDRVNRVLAEVAFDLCKVLHGASPCVFLRPFRTHNPKGTEAANSQVAALAALPS